MDWQHMNRKDQNIMLKRYGFLGKRVPHERNCYGEQTIALMPIFL